MKEPWQCGSSPGHEVWYMVKELGMEEVSDNLGWVGATGEDINGQPALVRVAMSRDMALINQTHRCETGWALPLLPQYHHMTVHLSHPSFCHSLSHGINHYVTTFLSRDIKVGVIDADMPTMGHQTGVIPLLLHTPIIMMLGSTLTTVLVVGMPAC